MAPSTIISPLNGQTAEQAHCAVLSQASGQTHYRVVSQASGQSHCYIVSYIGGQTHEGTVAHSEASGELVNEQTGGQGHYCTIV